MADNSVQPENADLPMEVTPSRFVTFFKDVQPEKADSPIFVILVEQLMLVGFVEA